MDSGGANKRRLRLALLGRFKASVIAAGGSEQSLVIPSSRHRGLIGYLALQPAVSEQRERLATLIWSEKDDRQARQNLRQAILQLRKVLDGAGLDVIHSERDAIMLVRDAIEVDATAFSELARSRLLGDMDRAMALYQGPLLDGVEIPSEAYSEWLGWQREQQQRLAADLFERAARAKSGAGAGEGAVRAAERGVEIDPANEGARRTLIEMLARHRGRVAAEAEGNVTAAFIRRELDAPIEQATKALIDAVKSGAFDRPAAAIHTSLELQHPAASASPKNEIKGRAEASESVPMSPDREPAGASPVPIAAPTPPRVSSSSPPQPKALLQTAARRRLSLSSWRGVLAGGFVLLGVLLAGAVANRPTWAPNSTQLARAVQGTGSSVMVVLPFEIEGSESEAAGGLAQSLTAQLSYGLAQLPVLRIAATPPSMLGADKTIDVSTIGQEVGATLVLKGQLHLEAGKARISVAMIDTRTRLTVWSERVEAVVDGTRIDEETIRALLRRIHVAVMEVHNEQAARADARTTDDLLKAAWAAQSRYAFQRGGDNAEQLFREVLRLDPDNPSALTGIGAFKVVTATRVFDEVQREQLLKEARELLLKSVELRPNANVPYYFLGSVELHSGKFVEAEVYYNRSIALNSSHAPSFGQLSYLKLMKGEWNDAISQAARAISLSPNDHFLPIWHYYLGRAHFERGDDTKAESQLRQAVQLQPRSIYFRIALIAFYSETERPHLAEGERRELAAHLPANFNYAAIEQRMIGRSKEQTRQRRLLAGLQKSFGQ